MPPPTEPVRLLHEILRRLASGTDEHAAAPPALTIEHFQIQGSTINLGPATIDLALNARGLRVKQETGADGKPRIQLQDVDLGQIEISAAKEHIERAIAAVANLEAGKHGVEIDQVELTLQPRGLRGLDAEVRLRAKKLFISTHLQITARLDLDQELTATISDLYCTGAGVLGSLACTFLAPQLQKLSGRSVSLSALPLGGLRLHDVRLAVSDRLIVTAEVRT